MFVFESTSVLKFLGAGFSFQVELNAVILRVGIHTSKYVYCRNFAVRTRDILIRELLREKTHLVISNVLHTYAELDYNKYYDLHFLN